MRGGETRSSGNLLVKGRDRGEIRFPGGCEGRKGSEYGDIRRTLPLATSIVKEQVMFLLPILYKIASSYIDADVVEVDVFVLFAEIFR